MATKRKKKTLKIILSKTTCEISKYFDTDGPWVTLPKCSNYFHWFKTWP